MFLIVNGEKEGRKGDWWLNEDDLRGVGSLLGRRVRGGRVHADIRRRLFDHERHRDRNRLSVMFEENAKEAKLKDDGLVRGHEKRAPRRGVTLFYQERPKDDDVHLMYVDSPEGFGPDAPRV